MNTILQEFIANDFGLKAIFTAGDGVEVNQSQVVRNYTVNLEWAYADRNRLATSFTVSGFGNTTNYTDRIVTVKAFNSNRVELPLIGGLEDDSQGTRTFLHNFDLSSIPLDETLQTFQLEVIPYGLSNRDVTPNQPNSLAGPLVPLSDPILINFNLSISDKVRILKTPQSITDQNITLTLQQVKITPSQIRIIICFIPPSEKRNWITISRLFADGAEIVGGVLTKVGIQEEAGEICNEFSYNVPMFDFTGSWEFEIIQVTGFAIRNDQQRITGSWAFNFAVP